MKAPPYMGYQGGSMAGNADISKVQMLDYDSGRNITTNDAMDIFLAQLTEQMGELVEKASGEFQVNPGDEEAIRKYKEGREKAVEWIHEAMAASMSTHLLAEMIETGWHTITQRESKFHNTSNASKLGGYVGMFVEQSFFGMRHDTKPVEDIDAIHTEIKTHISNKSTITVGGFTVWNLQQDEDANAENLKNIVMLHKMAEKMQNLLYFKVENRLENGKAQVRFPTVDLYLTLIFKRLYDYIYGELKNEKLITITKIKGIHTTSDGQEMAQSYSVSLNVEKLNNLSKITSLYLEKINLLTEGNDNTRKLFYSAVFDTQKTFGTAKYSPKFNRKINPAGSEKLGWTWNSNDYLPFDQ